MLSKAILLTRNVSRINKSAISKRFYPCTGPPIEETFHSQLREKDTRITRLSADFAKAELDLCKAGTILYKLVNNIKLDQTDHEDLNEALEKHRYHRIEDIKEDRLRTMRKVDQLSGTVKSKVEENKRFQAKIEANVNFIKQIEEQAEPLNQKLKTLDAIDLDSDIVMDRNIKYNND